MPPDVPPAAFGRFRVLHQIGVGSLGPVFRGEDSETRAPVAIKPLRLKLAPEVAARVADGLQMLVSALPKHPALPRAIAAGLHELDPYLVTTLVPGESLDVALREYGPASIADAVPRLTRLAEALDAAAAKGIWHGALQPRDILVSGQETQLVGTGIVPVLERARVRPPARRPYAAPEIVDGESSSAASDQYALAAIAYEWLFGGRAPVSPEAVLDAPALHGVNAEALASALMTGLAANPTDRFASCSKLVAAIARSILDSAQVTRPVAPVSAAKPAPAQTPLPLPLDAPDPAGEAALLPDGHLVDAGPPTRGLDDADADQKAPSPPKAPPPARPREGSPRLAWQGSFGGAPEPRPDAARSGFSTGTLVAVLLGGLAMGGAGGYLISGSRDGGAMAPDADRAGEAAPAGEPTQASSPTPSAATASAPASFTDEALGGAAAPGNRPASPTAVVPAPAAAPATDALRLLVRSSPAGAVVRVDGTPRGTTPITLRDLAPGSRTIVVSRPGFAAVERRVTLSANRPSQSLDVQLTPLTPPSRATREAAAASTPATIVVESRPAGASVTIDGKPAGTTPLAATTIAPGTHTITIERPGYRRWSQTIVIKAGERRRLAASLEGGRQDG